MATLALTPPPEKHLGIYQGILQIQIVEMVFEGITIELMVLVAVLTLLVCYHYGFMILLGKIQARGDQAPALVRDIGVQNGGGQVGGGIGIQYP